MSAPAGDVFEDVGVRLHALILQIPIKVRTAAALAEVTRELVLKCTLGDRSSLAGLRRGAPRPRFRRAPFQTTRQSCFDGTIVMNIMKLRNF